MKSINLVWLSKTDLGNMNAGEGSNNLVDLKTYDNGQKPYISGQAIRFALKQAIKRVHRDQFKCIPEAPCTDIAQCWQCDLFGFLSPEQDVGADRRWSPVKVSPALGQIRKEIVTDLLLRFAHNPKDNAIAYVQLVENIYKVGLAIDITAVGTTELIVVEKQDKKKVVSSIKRESLVSSVERTKRVNAVLEAVKNLCDLAKQARNLTSMSPDILLISQQPSYNHRLQRALDLNDQKLVNLGTLEIVLKDLLAQNATIYIGFTPGVISNEDGFKESIKQLGLVIQSPIEALNTVMQNVEQSLNSTL